MTEKNSEFGREYHIIRFFVVLLFFSYSNFPEEAKNTFPRD